MTSFVIGKVVEPDLRQIKVKGENRDICSFGLLSGRSCLPFDVFDDSKIFKKVAALEDGDLVVAVVGSAVDGKGALRCYLNEIGECPEGLRQQLLSLVRV